jgi:hypothetical protein
MAKGKMKHAAAATVTACNLNKPSNLDKRKYHKLFHTTMLQGTE